MASQDLEELLVSMESGRVERKEALSDPDKVRQAICAFANDLPGNDASGVIFIGVKDNGKCANLSVTDEILRTLSDIKSDGNIQPFSSFIVQKHTLAGCDVAVVIVQPSDSPPVRYKGRVYIRVGPRRDIATPEEERRLSERRRHRDIPFDIRPVASSRLTDLDLSLFQNEYLPSSIAVDTLEQNQRTVEQQLASVRFANIDTEVVPTVLGILVVGKDPRQFFPGAYIQFLRVDGTELTDPIKDQREIDGPLSQQLRVLDEVLEAHISIATDVTSQPTEIASPDYPLVAIQQIARNAVLHRNYDGTNAPVRFTWFSDRIEISSPGGPYGQVNVANFGTPGITDYRNPHLAEAMKNLGYVQRFGLGIQLARKELEKNSSPPLEFDVQPTYVLAVIRRRR